jgi:hypothetical protein
MWPLPAADVADLLQLVVNSWRTNIELHSSNAAADATLRYIPRQLTPTAARRLLLTAAVRRHDGGDFTRRVAAVPAVKQHIDAPTLSAVLRLLLLEAGALHIVSELLLDQQAVMQQMSGQPLVELVHAALASRVPGAAWPFFRLPEVRQLGLTAVLELLSAAVTIVPVWALTVCALCVACLLPSS